METKQARSRYICCLLFAVDFPKIWVVDRIDGREFVACLNASSLDMKQVLYSIGLLASLSAPAELGLPRSSCICKKGNKCFCCHPPGLPRGKLWVRLNSAVTESLRKALHRGTCLRYSCLCLRRISSDLPGSRDSQGKGNHGVPRGMTEKPQWFLLEAPSGRHLLTMFV